MNEIQGKCNTCGAIISARSDGTQLSVQCKNCGKTMPIRWLVSQSISAGLPDNKENARIQVKTTTQNPPALSANGVAQKDENRTPDKPEMLLQDADASQPVNAGVPDNKEDTSIQFNTAAQNPPTSTANEITKKDEHQTVDQHNISIQDADVSSSDSEFEIINNELCRYTGKGERIIIPACVKRIGNSAFQDNRYLISIVIPESVCEIGESAFQGCSKLEKVTFSNGLITIGEYAFRDCESLCSVSLPDSVTELGVAVFWNCTRLRNVSLPEGLNAIPKGLFSNCPCLSEVRLPDSITAIGEGAFSYSGLKSIKIPPHVVNVERKAFAFSHALESIRLEGIPHLARDAFEGTQYAQNLKGYKHNAVGYGGEGLFSFDDPDMPTVLGFCFCILSSLFHYFEEYSIFSIAMCGIFTVIVSMGGIFFALKRKYKIQIVLGILLFIWNFIVIYLINEEYAIIDWKPGIGFILYNLGYLIVLARGVLGIIRQRED